MVTEGTDWLTIDQLAQRTGMTVRNIRAHQSRGLLPAPEIRGRTGYYSPEHVARLELIGEMQADGFNLKAIKRLLQTSNGAVEEMLGFRRALMTPFVEEEPEFVAQEELEERFGGRLEPKLVSRAEKLGFLRPLGEGRYEIPSPTIYRAGEELLSLGLPPEMVLSAAEQIKRRSEAIAAGFVELFLAGVWRPFVQAGRPDDQWPRVREAFERLRPLASEAVLAAFQQAMTEAVEEAFGKQLEQS